MREVYYVFIVLIMFSCSTNREKVLQHRWKYSEGFYLSDVIIFNDKSIYALDSLDILKNGIREATILDVSSKKMILLSNKNEKGVYLSW